MGKNGRPHVLQKTYLMILTKCMYVLNQRQNVRTNFPNIKVFNDKYHNNEDYIGLFATIMYTISIKSKHIHR